MREDYHFSLYVVGESTQKCKNILANLKELCRTHMKANYTLEVVDVTLEPDRAELEKVIATPTLLWRIGNTKGKLVGDFSRREKIVALLQSF